jgi:hypothetical protein
MKWFGLAVFMLITAGAFPASAQPQASSASAPAGVKPGSINGDDVAYPNPVAICR